MEPFIHVPQSANFGHIRLPNKNSIWASSPFRTKNRRACLRGYFRKFEHSLPESNALMYTNMLFVLCWIFSYVNLCSCLSCYLQVPYCRDPAMPCFLVFLIEGCRILQGCHCWEALGNVKRWPKARRETISRTLYFLSKMRLLKLCSTWMFAAVRVWIAIRL